MTASKDPKDLPPIAMDDPVTAGDLVPGRLIYRFTENLPRGLVRTAMPCCPRQIVRLGQREAVTAVCRHCSTTFDLNLWDQGGQDFRAEFTVAQWQFRLSRAGSPPSWW